MKQLKVYEQIGLEDENMKVEFSTAQARTFKLFLSFKGKDHLYIAIHCFG